MISTTAANSSGHLAIDKIVSAVSPSPISSPIAVSQRAGEHERRAGSAATAMVITRVISSCSGRQLVERTLLVDVPDLVRGAR